MSEIKDAYESGKVVGRCQGAREMELAIALDAKDASLSINQQSRLELPCESDFMAWCSLQNYNLADAASIYQYIARHIRRVACKKIAELLAEALKPLHNNTKDGMPPSCTECWVIGCNFDYNGVGCRNQVGAARSPVS